MSSKTLECDLLFKILFDPDKDNVIREKYKKKSHPYVSLTFDNLNK